MALSLASRFRGAMLGLAAGDALGTTLEFQRPGSFVPLEDIVGGGPFRLEAGQWTDDTSMMLCLAESLLECRGFHPIDQLRRYCTWYDKGHLSSNGVCFDVGTTIGRALRSFTTNPSHGRHGPTGVHSAGNGSLMRLAPVPLLWWRDAKKAIWLAGEQSKTTHGTAASVDACRYTAGLIIGALRGVPKDKLLQPLYSPVPGLWEAEPLAPAIYEVASGSFRDPETRIVGTGYVVKALEAALWALSRANNFADGALLAANLGNDADTTAAIYGQLAGAVWGEEGIPASWREKVSLSPLITGMADSLCTLSEDPARLGVKALNQKPEGTEEGAPSTGPLPSAYVTLKATYDDWERRYAHIHRRLLPGPHRYHDLTEFDKEIAELPQDVADPIGKEFHKRLVGDRERLALSFH